MVAYRVVQVSNDVDMDSPMTATNTLTTNSLNPQCELIVAVPIVCLLILTKTFFRPILCY